MSEDKKTNEPQKKVETITPKKKKNKTMVALKQLNFKTGVVEA